MTAPSAGHCELCDTDDAGLVIANEWLRVVLVDDALYPGFVRVIWRAHVREMTDLASSERDRLARTVWAVEQAQRATLEPVKINLASLGNVTPHLHWHVIARFAGDAHGAAPIWSAPTRTPDPAAVAWRVARLPDLRRAIAERVARVR